MTDTQVVIGLDGGGTHTRALCADLRGHVLARVQAGGSHPSKNLDAEENVHKAIHDVVRAANVGLDAVAGFVAGLAGFNSAEDAAWSARLTAVPDLPIQAHCVNDAVVAWAGALGLQPGIVAIGGTGSIVFGMTEAGEAVNSYDFRHYGDLQARHLAVNAVQHVVAGGALPGDRDFVQQIFDYFAVADAAALTALLAQCNDLDYDHFVHLYGGLTPILTQAAFDGSPLAQQVCDAAAKSMSLGIRLVGSRFQAEMVSVALVGSVIGSPYMRDQLDHLLTQKANRAYRLVEAALPPEAGAALLALERFGVSISDDLINRLRETL